uniref:Uncharacterized protein n=1 Tax=Caenorhabditis tropicalis TaxID=1561998 RepID=A0A1I7SZ44_9PELO
AYVAAVPYIRLGRTAVFQLV